MDREVYQNFNQSIYREQLSNGLKVQLLPMEGYHKTYAILTADFGSIDNHFVPYHQKKAIMITSHLYINKHCMIKFREKQNINK